MFWNKQERAASGHKPPAQQMGLKSAMFKFHEGASVALKSDNPLLGLAAGATGTVWAQYDTQPLAYEVTFFSLGSADFDALMHEGELADTAPAQNAAAESRARLPASV